MLGVRVHAGVPVRCRSVDNTISDIVTHNLVSPNAKRERRRKQLAWDEVGESVVEGWTTAMQQRRATAATAAAQHHSSLTGQPAGRPGAPMPPQPGAAVFRASEHGAAPAVGAHQGNARRAQGGAAPAPRQPR